MAYLFTIPQFTLLFLLSPILTLIRETFITWTAVLLSDTMNMKDSDAAMMSTIFPVL